MPVADSLEKALGRRFKNPELLREALSHKSFSVETNSVFNNERLEFLGDSILAAVVAHQLCETYPTDDEGALSKKKAKLVSRTLLAQWAVELNLGAYLYLGVGEESSGGRNRQSLLANAMEALIGALYLDGGYPAAERVIRDWYLLRHSNLPETDYKSRLQEMTQKNRKIPPSYKIDDVSGPDHDKTFRVSVFLGSDILGSGEGKSKKEAEQSAARRVLEEMTHREK
ncbi:MAG: ribonuclease III [Elusimicrobiota bacterium]